MRIFIGLPSGTLLALILCSNSLVAQAKNQDLVDDIIPAAAPLKVEDQKQDDSKILPETLVIDLDDTGKQADSKAKPAVSDSKTDSPKDSVKPKTEAQQSARPAGVKKNPGRFALSFDDLKFDQAKGEAFDRKLLTPKINSYHGGKVKIRGYIRPNFKQSGITKFIFVRDNKECCFGPQAAIYDNILVRLDAGESTNYTVRPITVEGDFVLKEYRGQDGEVWSLYRLYNAEVK